MLNNLVKVKMVKRYATVNGEELDAQSGQKDRGETPTLKVRLKTLARWMSINRHKVMASEHVDEQAMLETEQQTEQANDNELVV